MIKNIDIIVTKIFQFSDAIQPATFKKKFILKSINCVKSLFFFIYTNFFR